MTRSTVAASALVAAFTAITFAQPPQAPQPAKPIFVDGQAQIVPAFEDQTQWVRQTLWVETEFDSDGDGKRDRMFVDVTRPRQTETEGLKVPVLYESSPYFAGTSGNASFSGTSSRRSAPSRRRARRRKRSRFNPRVSACRPRSSTSGCRAGLPSCIRMHRAPACRKDA